MSAHYGKVLTVSIVLFIFSFVGCCVNLYQTHWLTTIWGVLETVGFLALIIVYIVLLSAMKDVD